MTGKEKCRLLRQIRAEIAATNGIFYETTECTYKGEDCRGTCPKCEQEITYLEFALNRKIANGEPITLVGLSLNTFQDSIARNPAPEPIIPDMSLWDEDEPAVDNKLQAGIETLDLSDRVLESLNKMGIRTVGDLVQKSYQEMLENQELDDRSIEHMLRRLGMLGLQFRQEYFPPDDLQGDVTWDPDDFYDFL